MSRAAQAIKQQLEAQRRRALAPAHDPIRRNFELGLANRMEEEAQALLIPSKPLKTGLGGEIVPQVGDGLPGLESVLQEPNLVNAEASRQRADLLEKNKALELGIEVAEDVKARGAVEQMLAHQLAACHQRALALMAESAVATDAGIACLKARTASRLLDSFARAAVVLQRLQTGAAQPLQVQHISVAGTAVVGQIASR